MQFSQDYVYKYRYAIEIYHSLAERYLYLPIIGFCLVVPVVVHGLAMERIPNPSRVNCAALIPLIVLLGLYSAAAMARNGDWLDNFVIMYFAIFNKIENNKTDF